MPGNISEKVVQETVILLDRLLSPNPSERPSAQKTASHVLFKTADDSIVFYTHRSGPPATARGSSGESSALQTTQPILPTSEGDGYQSGKAAIDSLQGENPPFQ